MANWHDKYSERLTLSDRITDRVAAFIGSWKFLMIQSSIFVIWVLINTLYWFNVIQFDPYPFILFNLFMSAEAAYSTPLIMMSQNRQSLRDRHKAENDYETNTTAKLEIETLQRHLSRIEIEKLDKMMTHMASIEIDKLDKIIKILTKLSEIDDDCG
jgi:uncharacterized membrane protein